MSDLINYSLQKIPPTCYGKFYCIRDYAFIQAIFNQYEAHPMQILRTMEHILGKKVFYDIFLELREHGLNTIESRQHWINIVEKMSSNLMILLNREPANVNFKAIYEEVNNFIWKKIDAINAKAVLIRLEQHIKNPQLQSDLKNILQKSNSSYAQVVLNKILVLVHQELKILSKQNFQDTIKSTTEFLTQTLDIEVDNTPEIPTSEKKSTDNIIEHLQHENESYRTALEIARHQLERLENEIEIIRNESKSEAIINFFHRMNSSQFAELLDQFANVEERLKEIKKMDYKFPVEVESIPIVIRIFMKFLKACEITPIKTIGEVIKINLSDSEHYQYEGSDFQNNQEEKNVKIISSGWQYQGQIISKPKAIEQMDREKN